MDGLGESLPGYANYQRYTFREWISFVVHALVAFVLVETLFPGLWSSALSLSSAPTKTVLLQFFTLAPEVGIALLTDSDTRGHPLRRLCAIQQGTAGWLPVGVIFGIPEPMPTSFHFATISVGLKAS